MDFIDEIQSFSKKIPSLIPNIQTEEATKNALIMPFIAIMGYNVFDPGELIPEFTADHGTKKGEKVDYAILKDGKPTMLIECKSVDSNLNNEQASQLFRYFSVTEAKVGILTNGVIYRFYSDLDSPNKMDKKPFLEINLLELKEPLIGELKRFTKKSFNLDNLEYVASELKYTKEIKEILSNELNSPSDNFVRFFASSVYSGKLTPKVRKKFVGITKNALHQFINDKINERLKSAMSENDSKGKEGEEDEDLISPESAVVTTEDEWEGYYIIRAICHEVVDLKRVSMRDAKSYCAVLFDDNNRKPIARMHFNSKQYYLVLFDENKKQKKVEINELSEIYSYSSELKNMVQSYLK